MYKSIPVSFLFFDDVLTLRARCCRLLNIEYVCVNMKKYLLIIDKLKINPIQIHFFWPLELEIAIHRIWGVVIKQDNFQVFVDISFSNFLRTSLISRIVNYSIRSGISIGCLEHRVCFNHINFMIEYITLLLKLPIYLDVNINMIYILSFDHNLILNLSKDFKLLWLMMFFHIVWSLIL